MERYDENIVRLLEAYLTGRLDEEGRKVLEEEFDRLRRQVADGARVLREEEDHEKG